MDITAITVRALQSVPDDEWGRIARMTMQMSKDDWKNWNVGDTLLYYGSDFDGSWEYTCTIVSKHEDYMVAHEKTILMNLVINADTQDLFKKI